jgi:hypothetical protein
MARVQMLQHISGGRADGTDWPHIGALLDCGEAEARELVSGQLARWAAEPGAEERAVMPADRAELAGDGQTGTAAGDGEGPEPENGSQPLVRDPKQAWVDHAVEQGAAPEDAAAMTKADLIEKYGNP